MDEYFDESAQHLLLVSTRRSLHIFAMRCKFIAIGPYDTFSKTRDRREKAFNMEQNNPDSLSEYFIKPGETSPFTDLLIDPAFKQAFDPDKPDSKTNLINLLNDILGPQLPHPITDVRRRGSEQNATGSKESKTTFFDLHCTDDSGKLIEIEVPKIYREIDLKQNENQWLFALRYSSLLKELPPPLQNKKFKHLTSVSQISNLKGEKLREYLMMKNARWDNEVVLDYIEQHDSDAFKKHDEKVRRDDAKEFAKLQKSKGVSIDIIADTFGLTKEEIEAL